VTGGRPPRGRSRNGRGGGDRPGRRPGRPSRAARGIRGDGASPRSVGIRAGSGPCRACAPRARHTALGWSLARKSGRNSPKQRNVTRCALLVWPPSSCGRSMRASLRCCGIRPTLDAARRISPRVTAPRGGSPEAASPLFSARSPSSGAATRSGPGRTSPAAKMSCSASATSSWWHTPRYAMAAIRSSTSAPRASAPHQSTPAPRGPRSRSTPHA